MSEQQKQRSLPSLLPFPQDNNISYLKYVFAIIILLDFIICSLIGPYDELDMK